MVYDTIRYYPAGGVGLKLASTLPGSRKNYSRRTFCSEMQVTVQNSKEGIIGGILKEIGVLWKNSKVHIEGF